MVWLNISITPADARRPWRATKGEVKTREFDKCAFLEVTDLGSISPGIKFWTKLGLRTFYTRLYRLRIIPPHKSKEYLFK